MNRLSKRMAHALRHDPTRYSIELDAQGWTPVSDLAKALCVTPEAIKLEVALNDKQRFALRRSTELLIRASHGHSRGVVQSIGLRPMAPPDQLYHGTGPDAVALIKRQGIQPMSRQYVHLSSSIDEALAIAARHAHDGRARMILTIDAKAMEQERPQFWRSASGIWLAEQVPYRFVSITAVPTAS